jgi:preprotein translocase subunit SecB
MISSSSGMNALGQMSLPLENYFMKDFSYQAPVTPYDLPDEGDLRADKYVTPFDN